MQDCFLNLIILNCNPPPTHYRWWRPRTTVCSRQWMTGHLTLRTIVSHIASGHCVSQPLVAISVDPLCGCCFKEMGVH